MVEVEIPDTVYDAKVLWGLPLAVVVYKLVKWATTSKLPLPPSPKRLPIIGNMLDMPTSRDAWLEYDALCKKHDTDILYLDVLGIPIIVLDSHELAIDLFEKRSALYSSRPRMPMIIELLGASWNTAFMPYSDMWRIHRRSFHQTMSGGREQQFLPRIIQGRNTLLKQLVQNPNDYVAHIRHFAVWVVLGIAYGINVQKENDPFVILAERAINWIVEAVTPGRFLVELFPILLYVPSWFPGANFKRLAAKWRVDVDSMQELPFAECLKMINEGNDSPSFVSAALADMEHENLTEEEKKTRLVAIKGAAGTMYGAGSETTISALWSFFLAMTLNPEVQKKAQEELDRILSKGQLPSLADQGSLPYMTAVVWELLRWRPAVPLGLPHLNATEDIFMQYRIPAKSVIFANLWSILHNEKMYPDPERFNPDRFIKDGKINPAILSPVEVVFGYGRRICAGKNVAYASVWLNTSAILASFEILKPVDAATGKVITPDGEYINGASIHPKPFDCIIRPRSKDIEQSILSTFST